MTWQPWAASLALVIAVLYLPHVDRATFVYEDEKIALPAALHPMPLSDTVRARGLSLWSWAQVHTPQGAHALSLGLHLLVVGLVGALGWRLTGSTVAGLAAAAIAGLHPLQAQAIAYAAERDDLIAAVGVLLAALCASSRRWWIWGLTPAAAVLAYMGKESGLAVGLIVPIVLAAQGRLREWMVWGGALAAWIGLVVWTDGRIVAGVAAIANMGESDLFVRTTPIEWLLLQATAVWRLLLLSLLPWPGWLTPDPDIAIAPIAAQVGAVVLLAGLVEGLVRLWRAQPVVAAGIAWCLAAVALRFVVQTPWSYVNGGHWYLSLIGLSLAAGAWISGAKERTVCL